MHFSKESLLWARPAVPAALPSDHSVGSALRARVKRWAAAVGIGHTLEMRPVRVSSQLHRDTSDQSWVLRAPPGLGGRELSHTPHTARPGRRKEEESRHLFSGSGRGGKQLTGSVGRGDSEAKLRQTVPQLCPLQRGEPGPDLCVSDSSRASGVPPLPGSAGAPSARAGQPSRGCRDWLSLEESRERDSSVFCNLGF